MKKKMIVLLAAALLTLGAAGSALANFGDQQLEMFAYNGSTEVAVDLGAIDVTSLSSMESSLASLAGTINIGATAVSGLTGSGNIYAGIMGIDFANTGNVVVSGKAGLSPFPYSTANYGGATGSMSTINGYYAGVTQATAGVATGSSTAINSYFTLMDSKSAGLGNFGSLVPSTVKGDATTTLTAAVAEELYWLDSNNATNFVDTGYEAIINTNGSVTIEKTPAATPIPAAIYLMGSGLLGMFGLRRRKNG